MSATLGLSLLSSLDFGLQAEKDKRLHRIPIVSQHQQQRSGAARHPLVVAQQKQQTCVDDRRRRRQRAACVVFVVLIALTTNPADRQPGLSVSLEDITDRTKSTAPLTRRLVETPPTEES